LITPETLFGQLTGFREVKLGDKDFDRMFHVIAGDEEPARRLLSPAVRSVLLSLRKSCGKLQLNDRELFVTLNGHTVKKLPETIEALRGVGSVIAAENE
jgi:hypothetical protein